MAKLRLERHRLQCYPLEFWVLGQELRLPFQWLKHRIAGLNATALQFQPVLTTELEGHQAARGLIGFAQLAGLGAAQR